MDIWSDIREIFFTCYCYYRTWHMSHLEFGISNEFNKLNFSRYIYDDFELII